MANPLHSPKFFINMITDIINYMHAITNYCWLNAYCIKI